MKKYLKSLLIIFSIILLFLIVLFTIRPLQKSSEIKEEYVGYKRMSEGKILTRSFKTVEDTLALIFYNDQVVREIELKVTVRQDKKIIYQNVFYDINHIRNFIYFKESVPKNTKLDITFEVLKTHKDLKLSKSKNSKNTILIDTVTSTNDFNIIIWLTILYGICLFLILKDKNYKNKNKYKVLRLLLLYISYLGTSLISACLIMFISYCAVYRGNINIFYLLILLFIVSIAIYISTILLKNKKTYEQFFLLLAIPLISFYCIFAMPDDIPDEYKHFIRAYEISEGQIVGEKSPEVPKQIINNSKGFVNVKKLFHRVLEEPDYETMNNKFNMAHSYNPLLYPFSSIAVWIVKKANLNIYFGWYLGKFLNLVFYLILGYFTVKKIPKFKLLTILYLLMPMNLYLCASVSCDALINTCLLYLIAHMLNIYSKNKKVSFIDYILLLILGYVGIVTKPVYFPIIIGMLIICRKQFFENKKQSMLSSLTVILMFALYIIWQKMNLVGSTLNPTEIIGVGDLGLKYVILHPLSTMKVMFDFVINGTQTYLLECVGLRFLWGSGYVPVSYPVIYFILIVLSATVCKEKINYSLFDKIIFVACYLIAFGGIAVAMYAYEYRSSLLFNYLWGVQGRYFIPVMLLPLFCLIKPKEIKNNNKTINIIVSCAIIIHILYLVQLMGFFLV